MEETVIVKEHATQYVITLKKSFQDDKIQKYTFTVDIPQKLIYSTMGVKANMSAEEMLELSADLKTVAERARRIIEEHDPKRA